jgi:dATP/dGTP diphosphohydrolase
MITNEEWSKVRRYRIQHPNADRTKRWSELASAQQHVWLNRYRNSYIVPPAGAGRVVQEAAAEKLDREFYESWSFGGASNTKVGWENLSQKTRDLWSDLRRKELADKEREAERERVKLETELLKKRLGVPVTVDPEDHFQIRHATTLSPEQAEELAVKQPNWAIPLRPPENFAVRTQPMPKDAPLRGRAVDGRFRFDPPAEEQKIAGRYYLNAEQKTKLPDSGERDVKENGFMREPEGQKPDFVPMLTARGLELVPAELIRRIAEHYYQGGLKYEPDNWRRGTDEESLTRNKRSAARHFVAWLYGRGDEDHLAAVTWNMITYEINRQAANVEQAKADVAQARTVKVDEELAARATEALKDRGDDDDH